MVTVLIFAVNCFSYPYIQYCDINVAFGRQHSSRWRPHDLASLLDLKSASACTIHHHMIVEHQWGKEYIWKCILSSYFNKKTLLFIKNWPLHYLCITFNIGFDSQKTCKQNFDCNWCSDAIWCTKNFNNLVHWEFHGSPFITIYFDLNVNGLNCVLKYTFS